MGRPRKSNYHLPVGVYYHHGAYYRVTDGVWRRLDAAPTGIGAGLSQLQRRLPAYKAEMLAFTMKLIGRARQNARGRRGIQFALTKDDVHRMLNESGWCCAVSGIAFSLELVNGKRPYAPSIDRVDCAQGYLSANCRVVCVAVNYAMNVWGEKVIWNLFARKDLAKTPISISQPTTQVTV